MRVLNISYALIAFISTKCAVSKESDLRYKTNFGVLQESSVKNKIERSFEGFSNENAERGLQGLGQMRSTLLRYWNKKRTKKSIQKLKRSGLGNRKAQSLAKEMADTGGMQMQIDPSYGENCHGSSALLAARHNSLLSIFNSWYNSTRGANIMNENVRFTGIGIAKRGSSDIYAVQIFCSFNFVKNIKMVNTGNGIRKNIWRNLTNIRRNNQLDQIQNSTEFHTLAQTWAKNAAERNEIGTHDDGGSGSFSNKCRGSGAEVVACGIKSNIESIVMGAISTHITDGSFRFTGVAIAVRNDGAVFFVQLFCALNVHSDAQPRETKNDRIISFITNKENSRRQTDFKTSSLTTEYAQEWADKLASSNTTSEDPELSRGCGAYSFQILARGSTASEIWTDVFRRNKKDINKLGNSKFQFVGTAVASTSNEEFVLVQNFCTWKPNVNA